MNTSVINNLVSQIIDYAGLFPPASLPLDEVVSNYETYLSCDDAWMLARLILPIGQVTNFEKSPIFVESKHTWKISALIPTLDADNDAFQEAIKSIQRFNGLYQDPGKAIIDAVEIKTPTIEHVAATIAKLPMQVNAFLEIPHHDDPDKLIAHISRGGDNIFAKIRTGGITPELIPSPGEVARFIVACAGHRVGFKATAGLHHPLRGEFRLTYEDQPETGTMFGFINVFVAACFAFTHSAETKIIEQILCETNAKSFEFNSDHLNWNGHSVAIGDVQRVRKQQAISFGSCSFTEPTTELQQLGWLASTKTV